MKFILIFGPQAVGKMTVGQELTKITNLKLFHNHMTIELVQPFFDFETPSFNRLVNLFRQEIFEEVSKSDLDGIIFTYVWAFNESSDWDFVNKTCELFESRGNDVYFVELEADIDSRIQRNKTPNRLEHKPTKRNIEHSESELISSLDEYRLNSIEGEIKRENYIKINNSDLGPDKVASIIKERFKL